MKELTKQERVDRLYLRMAFTWSKNSYALRRQVGCLVVKDNAIISDGYNGTPSGFPNVCEYAVCPFDEGQSNDTTPDRETMKKRSEDGWNLVTYPIVLHAESNAIAKLARSGNSSDGATIYITDEPCIECSKLIIQSGIKRVVYSRPYRIHNGIDLLQQAKIEVVNILPADLIVNKEA